MPHSRLLLVLLVIASACAVISPVRADLLSPAPGTTLTASTTFRWEDQQANAYLLRMSAVGCFKNELGEQFNISGTQHTFSGTATSNTLFVTLYAQTTAGRGYAYVQCARFNSDLDGDGIFNDRDARPTERDEPTERSDTSYTVSVLPTGRVVTLKVTPTEYQQVSSGDSAAMRPVINALYRFYKDEFDFIFVTSAQATSSVGYLGRYTPVRNDTQGLGMPVFNQTASWGADAGRLQGVIHFPDWRSFSSGPGLHELAHRWANSLDAIPTTVGGHWGYSSGGGQLGGWAADTLKTLGSNQYEATSGRDGRRNFGTFANGGNGLPYSNIERYLMGMIPFSELDTMQYATDPQDVDMANGRFSASSIVTVTPAQLVATDGARVPAFDASQKTFSVLNVVLTAAAVTPAELASFDDEAYKFSLAGDDGTSSFNFHEATGGAGTLVMDSGLSALRIPVAGAGPEAPVDDEICVMIPLRNGGAAPICF